MLAVLFAAAGCGETALSSETMSSGQSGPMPGPEGDDATTGAGDDPGSDDPAGTSASTDTEVEISSAIGDTGSEETTSGGSTSEGATGAADSDQTSSEGTTGGFESSETGSEATAGTSESGETDGGGSSGTGETGESGSSSGSGGSDGCDAAQCDQPPAHECVDERTLREFDATGSCEDGVCTYAAHEHECGRFDVCAAGACEPNPECVPLSGCLDPFASSPGTPARRSDLLGLFPGGSTFVAADDFELAMRRRQCNETTGCSDWYPAGVQLMHISNGRRYTAPRSGWTSLVVTASGDLYLAFRGLVSDGDARLEFICGPIEDTATNIDCRQFVGSGQVTGPWTGFTFNSVTAVTFPNYYNGNPTGGAGAAINWRGTVYDDGFYRLRTLSSGSNIEAPNNQNPIVIFGRLDLEPSD